MAEVKISHTAPFRVRATLPTLTKWSVFGYTTREEAESLIAAMKRDNWTVESRGVNSPVESDWRREYTSQFELDRY
jgi:hypothetical protein